MAQQLSSMADTAIANAMALIEEYKKHSDVESFMAAPDPISFHSTYVSDPLQDLELTYDVDGLVLELHHAQGIRGGLHYLLLPNLRRGSLVKHYSFLKKHVDLSTYSQQGIKALRNILGHTVGYLDGGYQFIMTAMPADKVRPDPRLLNLELYKTFATEMLNNVVDNFRKELRSLSPGDMSRPSIRKQYCGDTSRFHILRKDCPFIMDLFDKAIKGASGGAFMKVSLFINAFGQKDTEDFFCNDIVSVPDLIKSVSVHVACNVRARDPDTHILFSRYGLEQLVGQRGALFTCLGVHEACNFQSNLDHRSIDLSHNLMDVFKHDGKVTFVQFYCDSPHAHIGFPFKHPVSGVLVTCGLCHTQYSSAVMERAVKYIDHMADLRDRVVGQLASRVEYVVRFEGSGPDYVNPPAFFDEDKLRHIFSQFAIILPYKELDIENKKLGLITIVREIMAAMIKQLTEVLHETGAVAKFIPVWKAYQLELALEELIYGHPLSYTDHQLSVSLGTNTTSNSSLSTARGFLGLEVCTRATSEVVPPPLCNWTKQQLQELRIRRMFPLCQMLEASDPVTGAALVTVLLGDLYPANDNPPFAALKSREPPGKLIGAWDLETLCSDLATKDCYPPPYTFGRALQILKDHKRDTEKCLLMGFHELQLNFFPAVRFRDLKGGKKLFWARTEYVQVHRKGASVMPISKVADLTLQVCIELERLGLTYSRNIEKYREGGMPWMAKVLERLPPNISQTPGTQLKVLTFLSSVAMIMNGEYIAFTGLRSLLDQVSQSGFQQGRLQKLQILSRFTLPKITNCIIWKLHEDIPHRVPSVNKPGGTKRPFVETPPEPEEDVQEVDLQDDQRPVDPSPAKCLPFNTSRAWTQQEESFLPGDRNMKIKDAYTFYLNKCQEAHIPRRSFSAFRQKLQAKKRAAP